MDEEPRKPVINVGNASALIDLKAEFVLRKKNLRNAHTDANLAKSSVLTLTKQEKSSIEEQKRLRTERIRRHEDLLRKETEESANRKRKMEEKSLLYEKMKSGEDVTYDDGSRADFLVNFEMKRNYEREREDDRHHSPPLDSFAPLESDAAVPLAVHYDPAEDKGRIFGASHQPLPKDETERQNTIEQLKDLSKKTVESRRKRKKQLDEKKRQERERTKKFRARYNLDPLSSTSEEDEPDEETPSSQTEVAQTSTHSNATPSTQHIKYGVREWDADKSAHSRWITKQRDERSDDFRPPSFYYK